MEVQSEVSDERTLENFWRTPDLIGSRAMERKSFASEEGFQNCINVEKIYLDSCFPCENFYILFFYLFLV